MKPIWKVLGALVVSALLAACASGTTTTPSQGPASSSTSPVAVHTAQPGEPPLIQVAGYAYSDLKGDVAAAFDARSWMRMMNKEAGATVVTGASAHAVKREGSGHILVMEFQIARKFTNDPGAQKMMVNSIAGGLTGEGATVSQRTIASEQVAYAQPQQDLTIYAWFHDGVVTMTLGQKADETDTFVEQYLKTAHGTV